MDYKFRLLSKEEEGLAKDLFCTGFDTTLEEADIFFRPQQKTIIGAFKEGDLCSMFTVFDCDVVLEGETIAAGYMAGVATDFEHRGNNLFSKCFEFYLERHCNYKIVFCIPASDSLFDFYRKNGMNETTYVKELFLEDTEGIISDIEFITLEKGNALDEYIKNIQIQNKGRKLYIKRPEELCRAAAESFLLYGGKIITNEGLTILFYEGEGIVNVVDIFSKDWDFEKSLEEIIKLFGGGKKIRFILPYNKYTENIRGKKLPLGVCLTVDKSVNINGLYINTLFNDI